MWLLALITVMGTCIYSGASTDQYGTNRADRYPPAPAPRRAADPPGYSNVIVDDYGDYGRVNPLTLAPARGKAKYVCPAEFVRSGNSCYYLSAAIETWQGAHFYCKDRKAELARMEKQWEDRNMRMYLNRPELAPLERWIGGIYNWEAKRWTWGATARNLGYQGFSRRRPNEDNQWKCIVMDPTMMYRWGTRSCLERKHFICEKRLKDMKPRLPEEVLRRRKDKWRRMNRKNNNKDNNRRNNNRKDNNRRNNRRNNNTTIE